uniref:Uncharacterized protein n=1 Tax=Oryza nivara TaxID=4536 RepID=A0A0E0G0B7_ORYNI
MSYWSRAVLPSCQSQIHLSPSREFRRRPTWPAAGYPRHAPPPDQASLPQTRSSSSPALSSSTRSRNGEVSQQLPICSLQRCSICSPCSFHTTRNSSHLLPPYFQVPLVAQAHLSAASTASDAPQPLSKLGGTHLVP